MRSLAVGALVCTVLCLACAGSGPASPSGEVPGASPLVLELPIRPGDSRNSAYGIWPFGVHGAGHAADGHPGYDFEYADGSPVLAAADGTVDNIVAEAFSAPGETGRFNLQLRHHAQASDYFTSYSNLVNIPSALVPRANVARGQVIGTAATLPAGAGSWAMSHFQLNDPTDRTPALSNLGAVNPELYFTAAAQAQLREIWRTSIYINEWCEPFLGNTRANVFPMSRLWTLRSGDGPASIEVRCPTDSVDTFEYTFRWSDGSTDSGRMRLGWNVRPVPSVDFISSSGSNRLGLYDIVEDTLQLALGSTGVNRPTSFAIQATYTSAK